MRFLSRALLVLPLVLVGSVLADDPVKPIESPYYPLKVGSSWYYKLADTHYTLKVTKIEEVDKVPCARIEMFNGERAQTSELVAVKSDGVYRYVFENNKADPPVLFLKLPPKKDETWEVNSTIRSEKLKGTFKAGEVDEVKVPAGTYKGVYTVSGDNLDANGTKISFTCYYAKDVGLIKHVVKVAGQEVVTELEKYEPGK